MKVTVKLFAVARQRIGASAIDVEVSNSATVGQLRRAIADQFGALKEVVSHSRIAIANEYASDDARIPVAAEIAVIPPVSGG